MCVINKNRINNYKIEFTINKKSMLYFNKLILNYVNIGAII